MPQPSAAVVELRKEREALELQAYPDPDSPLGEACAHLGIAMRDYMQIANWHLLDGAPWAYGYGWTHGVHAGMTCTPELGVELLLRGISEAYDYVRNRVGAEVFDTLDQGKVDALTDFAYNVQLTYADGSPRPCHLLDCVREGDMEGAAAEFLRWTHGEGGKVLRGLEIARAVERAWFLGEPRPMWTLDPHGKPPEVAA